MVFPVLDMLSARLATPFRWLMVAGIAYTLATSLTYLIAGPESAAGPAPAAAPESQPPRAVVDLESLLARNLFGVAGARPTATLAAAPAAVATQLPLELQGVFVAVGDGVSAAIIAQRGKPGLLYAVGQDVAGSATLADVAADHVILRRAGVPETLHFPQPGQGMARPASVYEPPAPMDVPYEDSPEEMEPYETMDEEPLDEDDAVEDPEAAASGAPAAQGELVARYRERLAADPEQALQSIGMTPVATGAASGYRVDNLAQAPYLAQTGLQPGDVILSVNGRPVGDLGRDRLEIDNVLAQGSARIEVQRGTRRFFVTASLP